MHEPLTTLLLVLITTGIAAWIFQHPYLQDDLQFSPEDILARKRSYRLVTSCFPHCGGWPHLLANMYSLYVLGGALEWRIGAIQVLAVYLGGVIGGNLLCLYLHRFHEYAAAGASGGVCGLLLAYVLLFPTGQLMLYPIPRMVPAWLYGIGFVLASFYAMKTHQPEIAHDAHLGGALSGLLIVAVLQPEAVRQHWMVFLTLVLLGGLIMAYVYYNPLFLPLESLMPFPRSGREPRPRSRRPETSRRRAETSPPLRPGPSFQVMERDWLFERIEEQVGQLVQDPNGCHDWIDKFGRSYHLVAVDKAHFDFEEFVQAVRDYLNTPEVRFVILDTRNLEEAQLALVLPYIGNLPETQFNRIIRSYGFDSH